MSQVKTTKNGQLSEKQAASLYRKHVNGAWIRAGGTLALWTLYAISGWYSDAITDSSFRGITLASIVLVGINPPTLYLLKRIRSRRTFEYLSLLVNIVEVSSFTTIVYYAGGVRANHFILALASVIAYVGVAAPRRISIVILIICMLEYNLLIYLEHFGFLLHQNPQWSYDFQLRDIQIIGFSVSALFTVVAYVAISTGTLLKQSRNKLRMRNLELDRINKIAKIANRSLDLDQILSAICQELSVLFPIRFATIALNDEKEEKLRIVTYNSSDSEMPNLVGHEMSWKDIDVNNEDIESMEPLILQEEDFNPKTALLYEYFKSKGIRSMLISPLIGREKLIGAIGISPTDAEYVFSRYDVNLIQTVSNQVSSAINNAQIYAKTESALGLAEHDLEIGRQIQTGFLPTSLPSIEGWEIASSFLPARQVAGDFYDAFKVGKTGAVVFLIGDVCDKGVGAALFMVVFRSLIRSFSLARQPGNDPEKYLLSIINTVNKYISRTHDRENMFATIFIGLIYPETNKLYYINAGHDFPYIVDDHGELKHTLKPTGPAIGLMADMKFTVKSISFNMGESLLAYTDGIIDSRNAEGVSFSEKSLLKVIQQPFVSALSMVTQVELNILEFIRDADQFDDIAMLCFRRANETKELIHGIHSSTHLENLPLLRRFIEKASKEMDLPDSLIFSFKLSLEEIFTNVNTFAYENQKSGPIKLKFKKTPRHVVLVIEDEGKEFDSSIAPTVDIDASVEERSIGGLGLFMIKEVMDKVEYKRIDGRYNQITLTNEYLEGASNGD